MRLLWPLAVPVYFFASRGWRRGFALLGLQTVLLAFDVLAAAVVLSALGCWVVRS
jgi:hypothetical protein